MSYDSSMPDDKAGKIDWSVLHRGTFDLNAPQIGLTTDQGLNFITATAAAIADVQAQAVAKQAYRDATVKANGSLAVLTRLGNACVKSINGFARSSATPDAVYELAMISPPAKNLPTPPPAKPVNARASLNPDGSVLLTWDGRTAGMTFVLQRQTVAADGTLSPWEALDYAGGRPAVDPTVPAGTLQAAYAVKAVIGKKASDWSEPANLRFAAAALAAPTGTAGLRIAA